MNVEDLYRLLRTSHVQAQGIVDTLANPLLVLDESLCVQNASRSFFETFKVDRYDTIGRRLDELGNGQWDIPELRRLLVAVIPKATAIVDFEVEHDFPALGRRRMLLTARRLHHPDTASHLLLLSIVDETERHRESRAKDLLFGELRHRMKNLLTVAQSLARHTTTEGRSAEEYRDDFLGRFGALVDAQDLAFAQQEDSGLESLLKRLLAPYAAHPGALLIEQSPDVVLGPSTIMSLSLIFHELATNAAKYGAWSVAEGQVRVAWQIVETNLLRIVWIERGGPPVSEPTRTGYGTQLIKGSTAYNLRGRVEQIYAIKGLEAEIFIPLGGALREDESVS